ncbi:MAG: hypothetical protein IJF15_06285 [Oscillospiraceae bacterium]|nr:hypothetical protein [Oscillospiraceae bacterium]
MQYKGLTEFRANGAKKSTTIFSGGVYVGENTSRPANVRAQASALRRGVKDSKKMLRTFFDGSKYSTQKRCPQGEVCIFFVNFCELDAL